MKVVKGDQAGRCHFKGCEGVPVVEGFCNFHYNIICNHESRYLLKNIAFLLQDLNRKIDMLTNSYNQVNNIKPNHRCNHNHHKNPPPPSGPRPGLFPQHNPNEGANPPPPPRPPVTSILVESTPQLDPTDFTLDIDIPDLIEVPPSGPKIKSYSGE